MSARIPALCWMRDIETRVSSPRGGPPLKAEDLVGTWRLKSWKNVASDGSAVDPLGENRVGYIFWTLRERPLYRGLSTQGAVPPSDTRVVPCHIA
jgi:hypothetical protein